MTLKMLQNLILEQPNLQVHVTKFWPGLKQLVPLTSETYFSSQTLQKH